MTQRDVIQNFDEVLASLPMTDDARTEARLCAVQAVFQWRLLGVDEGITDQFLMGPVHSRKAKKDVFVALFTAVKTEQGRYITMIEGCLREDWGFGRISTILQAILLVATAELATQVETPTGTVISEYLTITRAFEDEKQVRFLHGVLDSLARRLRV